ncbi:hypothetical protein K458DRAFT_174150 [Lentithecium fluviatile CBS 122367]|uniref:Uncharacterized protein n=1 Tax=Lentithecium fluviatile CBS 122367 TaxID=1168545 RepID=A0A6G1JCZ8_9PLEO|nr:hypothetical protein K458DRAFT_174150 [Lentithecium fluviatile CBS 122367]
MQNNCSYSAFDCNYLYHHLPRRLSHYILFFTNGCCLGARHIVPDRRSLLAFWGVRSTLFFFFTSWLGSVYVLLLSVWAETLDMGMGLCFFLLSEGWERGPFSVYLSVWERANCARRRRGVG